MKQIVNLIFEPKGKHNPELAYNIKDTVMDTDGSRVYFALQDVPAGIELDDEEYWKLQIDVSETKNMLDDALVLFAPNAKNIGMRVKGDIATATGNPVTFLPDAGSLLDVTTTFDPKQEGEGDPYPAGCGRNLLDASDISHRNKAEGETTDNGKTIKVTTGNVAADGLAYIRYVCAENPAPGTVFTLNVKSMTASANNKPQVRFIFAVDGSSVISNRLDDPGTNTITIPEYTGEGSLRVNIYSNTGGTVATGDYVIYEEVQVEVGETATAWQPYENIRPISPWDGISLQHDGTEYRDDFAEPVVGGGKHWYSGKLAVKWAVHEYSSSDDWKRNTNGNNEYFYVTLGGSPVVGTGATGYLCSHYPVVSTGVGKEETRFKTTNTSSSFRPTFVFANGTYTTVGAWKEFIDAQAAAGTPLQVAYPVLEPVEIQFEPTILIATDPEQENTLSGDGIISVDYVKPLHVSIEERVAAAVAAMTNG